MQIFNSSSTHEEIIDQSQGCDLFINNAYANGLQIRLIEDLRNSVKRMIVMGSVAADYPDPDMPDYSEHKRLLKEKFYQTAHDKTTSAADMLLLTLTGEAYKNQSVILNAIDFWLEHPTVNEMRFTV